MVNSVNGYSQPQYERKFSLGKTATSAVAGATLFKVANDALLRRNAVKTMSILRGAGADEFIAAEKISKSAVKNSVREAKKVLRNTQYLNDIKESIKNPKETVIKAKEFITNTVKNTSVENIKNNAKGFAEKAGNIAKSIKGETFKETLSNISRYTKSVKGRSAANIALGVVCGLMLFGTTKLSKTKAPEQNQA